MTNDNSFDKPDWSLRIKNAMAFGQFISYRNEDSFIRELESLQSELDETYRDKCDNHILHVYQLFLAACYKKAEETNSEYSFHEFFQQLFCSWTKVMQRLKRPPDEILHIIANWKNNDEYYLLNDIERKLIPVFESQLLHEYQALLENQLEAILNSKHETEVYLGNHFESIRNLKLIHLQKQDFETYIHLCEHTITTKLDCERIAKYFRNHDQTSKALTWVETGLNLKLNISTEGSDYELENLRKQILLDLGRDEEVVEIAWQAYCESPCSSNFKDLMQHVKDSEKSQWHNRAIDQVRSSSLARRIEIYSAAKEFRILAQMILESSDEMLKNISHYVTEEPAKLLEAEYPEAAAKLHCSLGFRIVDAGKSKYYENALEHFYTARQLLQRVNQLPKWNDIESDILLRHSRKSSFIHDFRKIIEDKYVITRTDFESDLIQIWEKQSDKQNIQQLAD